MRGKRQLFDNHRTIWRLLACLFVAISLHACATPQSQPVQIPQQQPVITDKFFHASDGARLPLHRWFPATDPEAIIIALHGFNDYGNAFAMPGDYFAAHGVAVLAYDQRGFGNTPHRGIWGGKENFIRDLAEMVGAVAAEYPDIPLYVLGESMGSAVVTAAMGDSKFPRNRVDGVILSGPGLWGNGAFSPLYRLMLWVTAHSFPEAEFTGRGLKIQASDNIEMLKALGRDPLVIKKTRADTIYGLVQMMDEGLANIAKLNKPLLFLYGRHDQVIPHDAIRLALRKIRHPYTFAYYESGWHMLLRDLQAGRVWRDVISWIESPQMALPSGATLEPERFIGKDKRVKLPCRKKWPSRIACDRRLYY